METDFYTYLQQGSETCERTDEKPAAQSVSPSPETGNPPVPNFFDLTSDDGASDAETMLSYVPPTDLDAEKLHLILNDLNELSRNLSVTPIGQTFVNDFNTLQKTSLIGRVVKSAEDFSSLALACRSACLDQVRWVLVRGKSVVHQTLVCLRLPCSTALVTTNDVFDSRVPADSTWFLREAMRWTGGDRLYLVLTSPHCVPHLSNSEIDLCDRLKSGRTEANDETFWTNHFSGILSVSPTAYSIVRANGEVEDSIPISDSIYAPTEGETPKELAVEREVSKSVSFNPQSPLFGLMVATDGDHAINGLAHLPLPQFFSVPSAARMGLLQRFYASCATHYGTLCFDGRDQDRATETIRHMLSHNLLSDAYVLLDSKSGIYSKLKTTSGDDHD